LVALVTLLAATLMDNLDAVRAEPGIQRLAFGEPHTWWISLLYVGTFGSFIGYGFAFGLVLQTQFGSSPLQAATYTFLGPLLGALFRPLGGWLADQFGGSRITLWAFVGLAVGTLVLLVASARNSFPLFVLGFIALFVLSGIGNGSTYKLIPAVFIARAKQAIMAGDDATRAFAAARRISGAVIGITGALGALGGVAVNLVFRATYGGPVRSGTPAFVAFIAFYALCVLVTWRIYHRRFSQESSRV
jgi:NNP family nitrate/nitrite transporter-like MFS transporter